MKLGTSILVALALAGLTGCDRGERKREKADPATDPTATKRGDDMAVGDSSGQTSSGPARTEHGTATGNDPARTGPDGGTGPGTGAMPTPPRATDRPTGTGSRAQ